MADATGPAQVEMRPTVSAASFLATVVTTLAAILVMLFCDLLLARTARREAVSHATEEYQAGRRLLALGDAAAAADHFEAAEAADQQNVLYALGLGEAMLAEGNLDDAASTLRALLDRAQNDGAVNLTMARVLEREGRLDDATAYYHRAIYGDWGSDSTAQRMKVRVELVDLLVEQHASRALAAELLPLEEAASDSAPLHLWIGQRLLLAGSPARAREEFRRVIALDPRSAAAYAGMGDVALRLGNFRTARADLAQAAQLAPADRAIAERLTVADTALALDPIAVDVSTRERVNRSRALLARTLSRVVSCGLSAANPAADSARALLALPSHAEEVGRRMLALATELWVMRGSNCAEALDDEPLALVHAHLAQ